jgi:hypothetical protein
LKKVKLDFVGSAENSNVIVRVQMSQSGYKATGKLYLIDSNSDETLYTSPTLKGQSVCLMDKPKKEYKKLVADLEENFDKKRLI